MTPADIVERARAMAFATESGSPDFIGGDIGQCVTCWHRNPDGPALFAIIETQAAEIAIIKTHSEKLARACEEKDAEIARKNEAIITRLRAKLAERTEALLKIADRLVDQRDEPSWTTGRPGERLHYWRGKAITAAIKIRAIKLLD